MRGGVTSWWENENVGYDPESHPKIILSWGMVGRMTDNPSEWFIKVVFILYRPEDKGLDSSFNYRTVYPTRILYSS